MSAPLRDGSWRLATFSARPAPARWALFLPNDQTKIQEAKNPMKYFTPELYLRFNSRDPAEVAKAHDNWEDALEGYREHLRRISSEMTANVRETAESLCLHDADYLGMAVVPLPDQGGSLATLLTRHGTASVFLI